MRIIINQSALDRHHKRLGLLRLSAPPAAREAATIAHVAQLVVRLGIPLTEVAEISPSAVGQTSATYDAVCGQCIVRMTIERLGRSA
ncbi:hypothetical protein ACWGR3_28865 [Streptomyces albidoflavus]